MSSKEAARRLKEVGFAFLRRGKGDHEIYQKGNQRVVISGGKKEISSGMVRAIEQACKNGRACASKQPPNPQEKVEWKKTN